MNDQSVFAGRGNSREGHTALSFAQETLVRIAVVISLLGGLYIISRYNYLLFHSLAELCSIAVAWSVFMLVWNSRRFVANDALVFLGIAYLFIGLIDVVHTLAYRGMGVFSSQGADLATQLWISARYMESLSLVIFTMRVDKQIRPHVAFLVYVCVTGLFFAAIFAWSFFPVCYVEGVGLTAFKKNSEYLICLILAGAAFLLWKKRSSFDPTVFRLLLCVILFTIASELAFTFYVSVYGFSNLIGHYLKLISFYLIYLSLIRSGLTRPYEVICRDYKQRESELQTANARWNAFSQYSSPLTIFDGSGRYVAVNPAAASLLGRSEEEIVGKRFSDVLEPQIHAVFHERLADLVAHQRSLAVRDTIADSSGVQKIYHSILFPIPATPQLYYGSIAVDITEQKELEKKSRRTEQMFAKVFHHTPLLMTISTIEECIYLDVNESFERITGYSREEAIGSTSVDLGVLTAEEHNGLKQRLLEEDGHLEGMELTLYKNNKKPITCLYWGEIIFFDGKPCLLSIASDISLQKQIESEREITIDLLSLINTEQDLHELMQSITLLMRDRSRCEAVGIRLKSGGGYPYFETRGFPPEFVQAESSLCIYDDQGRPVLDNGGAPVLDCLCGAVLTGRTDPEHPFFTKGGSFWTNSTTELLVYTESPERKGHYRNRCNREGYESVALIPLRYGGETFGLIQLNDRRKGMFTVETIEFFERLLVNISIALKERQEVQALHESEEKFRVVLKNSSVVVAMTDLDLRYTWIHNPHPDFLPERVIGMRDDELAQNKGAEQLLQLKQDVLNSGKAQRAQISFPLPGGAVTYDIAAEPLRDIHGNITGVATVSLDVTEHMRTREFMIQTEKMMSVGGMAAGIAHEINNPLAGILQNVQVLGNRLKNDMKKNRRVAEECGTTMEAIEGYARKRDLFQMIDSIMESGITAREIVGNLLSFSRKSTSQNVPVDLCDLIDKTLELAKNDYDLKKKYDFRKISIIREYEPNCPKVTCDSVKIQQVLLNLFKNSADAMLGMGRPPNIILRVIRESDAMVRVEVEDNGPGISEAVSKRIFEPFFTTKDVGEGTGLGLSISYFIITENHGGTMAVESTPGKGTNFIIRLPVKDESVES